MATNVKRKKKKAEVMAEDGSMTLNFDHDTVRTLWDNYYVPFIKGYFSASGRFRSDDVKTGNIIAYVGSSSSATFFPTQVIADDMDSHDITRKALESPKFANGEDYAVQQGAGMVVTKASDAEIQASLVFLKWFTSPEHNITFSVDSGYLPVTHEGNSIDAIRASGLALSDEDVGDLIGQGQQSAVDLDAFQLVRLAAGSHQVIDLTGQAGNLSVDKADLALCTQRQFLELFNSSVLGSRHIACPP